MARSILPNVILSRILYPSKGGRKGDFEVAIEGINNPCVEKIKFEFDKHGRTRFLKPSTFRRFLIETHAEVKEGEPCVIDGVTYYRSDYYHIKQRVLWSWIEANVKMQPVKTEMETQ